MNFLKSAFAGACDMLICFIVRNRIGFKWLMNFTNDMMQVSMIKQSILIWQFGIVFGLANIYNASFSNCFFLLMHLLAY